MLINPNLAESRAVLRPITGTRIIEHTLGVVGAEITDPFQPGRIWVIQNLYSPIPGRALGGLRAKLLDNKGFVTFCNQRDLEVLLGLGSPGRYCEWLGTDYAAPGDRNWCGFGVDEEDLIDDLYERELSFRAESPGACLPAGLELVRRVHDGSDFEELCVLVTDADPYTGLSPDLRLETTSRRWQSVERTDPRLRDRLWQMTEPPNAS
jgi:hypothetical protein